MKEKSTTPAAGGANSFPLIELPDLVILKIAKHLTTNDGRKLSRTCQRLRVSTTILKTIKQWF